MEPGRPRLAALVRDRKPDRHVGVDFVLSVMGDRDVNILNDNHFMN